MSLLVRSSSLVSLLLALAAGLTAGVVSTVVLAPATAVPVAPAVAWEPPGDTIVAVEGNRFDGFGIHFYDGTSLFPPTDSEALAECGEYDTEVAVATCRTEVRVWYRDLGQLKRALRYAHLT